MSTQDILAIRYSEAVFSAAQEAKAIDAVEQDFFMLESTLHANQKNKYLLIGKVVPKRIKNQFWEKILKANKFNEITNNFVRTLVAHNRLDITPKVIANFHHKVRDKEGILTAHVTTATELDKNAIKSIANDLKVVFGKEIEVKAKVRKKIIGGLVVRVGSKMIDYSINSKLEKMKQLMQSVRF